MTGHPLEHVIPFERPETCWGLGRRRERSINHLVRVDGAWDHHEASRLKTMESTCVTLLSPLLPSLECDNSCTERPRVSIISLERILHTGTSGIGVSSFHDHSLYFTTKKILRWTL